MASRWLVAACSSIALCAAIFTSRAGACEAVGFPTHHMLSLRPASRGGGMVDATDLKSVGPVGLAGSSPALGIKARGGFPCQQRETAFLRVEGSRRDALSGAGRRARTRYVRSP